MLKFNSTSNITILTSRLGYGSFIPALLLKKRYEQLGLNCDFLVAEDFYPEQKQNTFEATRIAFHHRPRLAEVTANYYTSDSSIFEPAAVKRLLSKWFDQGRYVFFCFSGFWSAILKEYKKIKNILSFYLIMDAEASSVWEPLLGKGQLDKTAFQFFSKSSSSVNYTLDVLRQDISFEDRTKTIILHGGGWGVIDPKFYQEFDQLDYKKICFINTASEAVNPAVCYYENINSTSFPYQFPHLKLVNKNEGDQILQQGDHHSSLDLIADSKAVISKPGGMTLLDSLMSATPVIFLRSIGKHENENRLLWIKLGLGIDWEEWKKHNYSLSILEKLHHNLLAVKAGKPDLYNQIYTDYSH